MERVCTLYFIMNKFAKQRWKLNKKQNKHENKTPTRCPRFDNNNLTKTRFGGELWACDVTMHQIFIKLVYLSCVSRWLRFIFGLFQCKKLTYTRTQLLCMKIWRGLIHASDPWVPAVQIWKSIPFDSFVHTINHMQISKL